MGAAPTASAPISRLDVRHLRRSVRRHHGRPAGAAPAAAAAASAAPTCATIWKSRSRKPSSARPPRSTCRRSSPAQTCAGSGRQARHRQPTPARPATAIGKVRAAQGFFTIERTCPDLPGPRPDHRQSLHRLRAAQGRHARSASSRSTSRAGIEDGTRIRLAGEGEAGLRGGPSGDLYIFISVKPHELFQRDGADLYCRVPISMTHGGARRRVRGADPRRRHAPRSRSPEGTQPGQPVPPQGKGMPVLRAKRSATSTSRSTSRRRRTCRAGSASCWRSSRRCPPRTTALIARLLRQAEEPV